MVVARGCGEGETGSRCLCFCFARWKHSGEKFHSNAHVCWHSQNCVLRNDDDGKALRYMYFITT